MGDEGEAAVGRDDGMGESVTSQIATQMLRLNQNLERQAELIETQRLADEAQRTKDRVSARRRWYVVMVVVLLIAGGNVRVEQVRREGDRRDKASLAAQTKREAADQRAQDLKACRRTNLSRAEIRASFDQQGEALVSIASESQRPLAARLVQETHDQLAASLKSTPCTDDPPATYDTCAEAIADGEAPLRRGQPGYRPALDADGDGVACE
jgi:hypothetical protein